jgi:hypothetical protein
MKKIFAICSAVRHSEQPILKKQRKLMKTEKFFCALLCSILLAAGAASAQTVASGTTGSCTWTLTGTSNNYTLTISGTGSMENYSYGSYAPWFSYRYSIKTLTIEQGVTSIGDMAFDGCSELTSVTIPNSVTSIGSSAFSGCSGLISVDIPNSVTSIGDWAFSRCSGLTSVDIPNSVTSIGSHAFYYCSELTSVTIPNSVTSIGEDAFSNCSGLTSITISASVTSIDESVFDGCSGLTSIDVEVANTKYSSGDGVLFNKDKTTLICYPAGKTGATYTIPSSVTSIDSYAFSYCSGLTSMVIPNSVTSIGNYAFYGCSELTSVTIPSSVTSIGSGAFYGCSGLTSVTIPASVKSIGYSAFANCSKLTSIAVESANANYASDNGVLFNKSKTKLLGYPGGKTGSYSIPASVTTIDTAAFYYCSVLTSVTIPNSVTSIGIYAFYYCSGLTSVTIPNSVTSIGSSAFDHCSGLTSVTIPEGVTSIADYVFSYCGSLTSVTIPALVTSIGVWAFFGCSGLKHIYARPATPPTVGINAFYDVNRSTTCTLYVPMGSGKLYKQAAEWKDFTLIEEMDMDGATGVSGELQVSVALYPNPFAGELRLTGAAGCTLTVVAATGAPVHTQKVAGADENIQLGRLPAGVYFLRIEKEGKVKTLKAVKL